MAIKELAILTSDILKNELIKYQDESDLLTNILDSNMYEFTVSKNKLFLVDIENKIVIEELSIDDNFQLILADKYNKLEVLKFGFFDINKFLPFFNNVNSIAIHGNFINSETFSKDKDIRELINSFKLLYSKFNTIKDIKDRLKLENEILELYAKLYILNYHFLSEEFVKFINDKDSKILELGWLPLSNNDYDKLSDLKGVEELTLLYNFKNTFLKLPKNIKILNIFCNLIFDINDVFLNLPKLESLSLAGNSIYVPVDLSIFPKKIEFINLTNNLIDKLYFDNAPKSLEDLILKNNQLNNESFIITQPNYSLELLDLCNNEIVINIEFLEFLDTFFPKLEYIDLKGNYCDPRIQKLLETDNQLRAIKDYLALSEFSYEQSLINFKSDLNFYNKKEKITLEWKSNQLPLNIIIKEIHFYLQEYIKNLDSKLYFNEGVYCDFEFYNTSMLIYKNDNNQSILLELYSDSLKYIEDYFFKYLQWLKELIDSVTCKRFVPSFESSKKLNHLEHFYRAAYGIEYKLKKNYFIKVEKNIELLICDDKKLSQPIFKPVNDILFIVVSSKTAYFFYIDNNTFKIYNKLKINESLFKTELIIREGVDKQNLKEVLTNEYLDDNRFSSVDLYIDNKISGKVNLLVNSDLVYVDTEEYTRLFLNNDYEWDNLLCNTLLGTYRVIIEKNEIKLSSRK